MTIERAAGHRVLRLLARGARTQVWLAADDVVLKVLAPPVPVGAPGREAEALHRARGEHVVELLDVSLGAEGAVLVFPRLTRGSLAELLARRSSLEAGEAVTILAPIATCLGRLHSAGIAHTALSPEAVLFRADGAPMLTGFGSAELFEPGIPEVAREGVAGVIADRTALRALADDVLSRTSGSRGKAASRLRAELRGLSLGDLAERMTGRLFDLAAARPVDFEAADEGRHDHAGRVVAVGEAPAPEVAGQPATGVRGTVARVTGLQGSVARVLDSGPGSVARAAVVERWVRWPVRRRRAAVAAGAAGLALVLAMALVPSPEAPAAVPANIETPPAGIGLDESVDDESGLIGGDDPLAALRELAGRREDCFRELSVLCLDGVDEEGSSAWDADRAAIQAILEGGAAPHRLSLTAASLVERNGDSALIDLGPDSDPASILLLKGEAGWRIRDYLGRVGGGG